MHRFIERAGNSIDWIKVKVKHAEYDFSSAPDNVFKAWIMMMIYVAATERKPLRNALRNRLGEQNLVELEKWLQQIGISIDLIIDKVLEDVERINVRKSHERKYMHKYRCKDLRNPLHKDLRNGKEKIREDKNKELQSICLKYKEVKGFTDIDNKWWQRNVKIAKDLLITYGDVKRVFYAIDTISEDFKKKGLSWTLETVLKRYDEISKPQITHK